MSVLVTHLCFQHSIFFVNECIVEYFDVLFIGMINSTLFVKFAKK